MNLQGAQIAKHVLKPIRNGPFTKSDFFCPGTGVGATLRKTQGREMERSVISPISKKTPTDCGNSIGNVKNEKARKLKQVWPAGENVEKVHCNGVLFCFRWFLSMVFKSPRF